MYASFENVASGLPTLQWMFALHYFVKHLAFMCGCALETAAHYENRVHHSEWLAFRKSNRIAFHLWHFMSLMLAISRTKRSLRKG